LFESTRYARGHKALYTLEINGEFASIRWDLSDLHRLEYFDHRDEGKLRGWRSIHVSDHGGAHPYMDKWWVPLLQNRVRAQFSSIRWRLPHGSEEGRTVWSHVRDALETQKVCEAVLNRRRKAELGGGLRVAEKAFICRVTLKEVSFRGFLWISEWTSGV
jgi:hypothetical protein